MLDSERSIDPQELHKLLRFIGFINHHTKRMSFQYPSSDPETIKQKHLPSIQWNHLWFEQKRDNVWKSIIGERSLYLWCSGPRDLGMRTMGISDTAVVEKTHLLLVRRTMVLVPAANGAMNPQLPPACRWGDGDECTFASSGSRVHGCRKGSEVLQMNYLLIL